MGSFISEPLCRQILKMIQKVKFLYSLKEKLELLRAFYDHGTLPALYDALVLCRDFGVPLPSWVLEGTINAVADRLVSGKPSGSDSSIVQPAAYHNRMKHLRRWQVVKLLQAHGFKTPNVFKEAEAFLGESFAGNVTHKAIEASFYKVQHALKDPAEQFEYYTLSTGTAEITKTPTVTFPKS